MGSFSIWHWLVVLVIVVLVFGTKRLKNVGQDLGEAIKGFKKGVSDDDRKPEARLGDDTRSHDAPGADPARPDVARPDMSRPDVTPVPPRDDDRSPR